MKKLLATLLLSLLLTPHVVTATEVHSSEEPMIAPLNHNQPAPFPGVLFNKSAAAKVTVEYKHETADVQVEVDKAVADVTARKDKELLDASAVCTREKSEKDARILALDETLKLKQKEADDLKIQLENAPSRSTWFGIGFASGLAFTLITVFAVGQVAK